jgi:hypothetical protein
MKVENFELRSDKVLQFVVRSYREEALGHVPIGLDRALPRLSTVDADEQEPTRTKHCTDRVKDRWQLGVWHVEETVHGEHGVE